MPHSADIPPAAGTAGPSTPAGPADLTFAEAWKLWLAYRSSGARPLRASTRADYESAYRRHLAPAFAAVPLCAIDGMAVARLSIALGTGGLTAKRVSNILVPLRACLRWHHRIGTLPADPSPWFEASARPADERCVLTPVQVEALLAALPPFYRPMVAFAAGVGVRAGELRALTWHDLDLSARTARIDKSFYRDRLQRCTKTGAGRTVPLPPHVVETLLDWGAHCPRSDPALVFPRPNGAPLDLDTFRARVFKPAVARAGLPARLRFHDLRHTSATLYLRSGATVREVMEIHGWTQMQTAMRYLHAGDGLAEAAERFSRARADALRAASGSRTWERHKLPTSGR
ncbi:MAG: site-specific integrase [Coriobacteriia bacterium]|nr:site-specific integrase [Coriobacteriia bacterium]